MAETRDDYCVFILTRVKIETIHKQTGWWLSGVIIGWQVSAAQHLQVSGAGGGGGHVSVAAQQGMYANFQHQGAPSPQHHQSKMFYKSNIYHSLFV